MRVALYTLTIDGVSGKEATIFNLAGKSKHQWTIFTSYLNKETTAAGIDGLNIVELKDNWVLKQKGLILKACLNLPRKKLPLEQYDILFIVSGGVDHLLTFTNRKIPTVCLCLTPLRLVYDQSFQDIYFKGMKLSHKLYAGLFKLIDRHAWQNLDHIFCISQEVKNRLLKHRVVDNDSIDIAYPCINIEKINPTSNYDKYFFLPGRIHWSKNIALGIKAFKKFQSMSDEFKDFKLIVAGRSDQADQDYLRSLKNSVGESELIKFFPSPSDNQYNNFYRNCYAVLFTAVNEDFGIVPLEGMAFGKPVLCLNEGGPKETVIDNKTGYLVNNREELAEALANLARNPELVRHLGQAGRKQAFKYNCRLFVEKIDNYLETLIK